MPSISTAKLKELTDARDKALTELQIERDVARMHRRQMDNVNAILDKIVKAAQGCPLDVAGFYGCSGVLSTGDSARLTDVERQALEQERVRERVVSLESRLAAVVAVAQFAKAHKSP